ncbi:histidine kinase dimerization/phospho-acceptor domain-containing protein [Bradyrhizobium guangdongense]|uniref:histidine kinase dimerization/phospho-acceptor domain-containing protein n=1 Tax=Bradyrhizobium guangdongense TaxID=1325090 RepID=UPI001FEE7E8E|nr:histidine kinase dimerization/phospho-acceptor domain-containing protein [Bradyrhizobium guangdongense]
MRAILPRASFARSPTLRSFPSIAHELNQPLGSILTNAETAEIMLKSGSPDLDEIREILADIRRDDHRASEVIRRLRSILRKTQFEAAEIDLTRPSAQRSASWPRWPMDDGSPLDSHPPPRPCTSQAIPFSFSRSSST